jgi:CTP:molybdopterin cytidylyltransferase MocA
VTAAIVLAAGASTRLGEPKQLVVLGGETLLERALRTARAAGCMPVVIVLGARYVEIVDSCTLSDAVPVINHNWKQGMSSSIRLGVQTLESIGEDSDGVVLMTCDQPAVTAEHLRALMTAGDVRASGYAGQKGVPAYFPAASFAELMALQGDTGARELLRGAEAIELPGGELDVDTADHLAQVRRWLATA